MCTYLHLDSSIQSGSSYSQNFIEFLWIALQFGLPVKGEGLLLDICNDYQCNQSDHINKALLLLTYLNTLKVSTAFVGTERQFKRLPENESNYFFFYPRILSSTWQLLLLWFSDMKSLFPICFEIVVTAESILVI